MSRIGAIRGLGEVALQVQDLDRMTTFYRDVIGLEVIRRFESSSFFRIAEGIGGHTQILALFDRIQDDNVERTPQSFRAPPLDHFAFAISLADFESERQRLERDGCEVTVTSHGWVGWRSLYVADPEGNQVELVCYDAAALDAGT